MNSGVNDFFF
jgi:hypothetical protein